MDCVGPPPTLQAETTAGVCDERSPAAHMPLQRALQVLKGLLHRPANILYRNIHKALLGKTIVDDDAGSLGESLVGSSEQLIELTANLSSQTLLLLAGFYDRRGRTAEAAAALASLFRLDEIVENLDEETLHLAMSVVFGSEQETAYLTAIEPNSTLELTFPGRGVEVDLSDAIDAESKFRAALSEKISADYDISVTEECLTRFVDIFTAGEGKSAELVFQQYCDAVRRYCDEIIFPLFRKDPNDSSGEVELIQTVSLLSSELGHALKQETLMNHQRQRYEQAAAAANSLLLLDSYTECLGVADKNRLIGTLVIATGRTIYLNSILELRTLFESFEKDTLEAELKDIAEWPAKVKNILKSENWIPDCIQFVKHIRTTVANYPRFFDSILRPPIFDVFFVLNRKRSELGKVSAIGEVTLCITQAMLILNQTLRNMGNTSPEMRLEDLYYFHRCIRPQPALANDPEVSEQIKSAMKEAHEIGTALIQRTNYIENMNPKRKFYVCARVGEICHAQLRYQYAPPEQTSGMMAFAISTIQEAVKLSDKAERVFNGRLYEMLGDCNNAIGEYESAVESFQAALNFRDETEIDARRRLHVRISDNCREVHRTHQRNDPEKAARFLLQGKENIIRAVRLLDLLEDPVRSLALHPKNIEMHGRLAVLALDGGDNEEAEKQARWFCDHMPPSDGDDSVRRRVLRVLGTACLRQRKNAEAISIFESLLKDEQSAALSIHYWRSLRALCRQEGNHDRADQIAHEIINISDNEVITSLTEEQKTALFSREASVELVDKCERYLLDGRASKVLNLVSPLVQASAFLELTGKPDRVFLGLQGLAQLDVGNSDAAMESFLRALRQDRSAKNQGIVWQLIGKAWLREGNFEKAAEAFENSHWIGEAESLGALLLAAKAYVRSREYAKAIEHLTFIANSGSDQAPEKTSTELAWAFWRRYCDYEREVGGDEEDVERACNEIGKVLSSRHGAADPYAVRQLVDMASHPIAQSQIIKLLQSSSYQTKSLIIEKLEAINTYEDRVTEAVVELVPQDPFADYFPSRLRGAIRLYVIGALIKAYVQRGRAVAVSLIEKTLFHLFRRTRNRLFWAEFLTSNARAMEDDVTNRMVGSLRRLLITNSNSSNLLTDLLERALPEILSAMETGLLGLLDVAYAGRDLGRDIRNDLRLLMEFWESSSESNLSQLVDLTISVDGNEANDVSLFQINLMTGFLNQLLKKLSDKYAQQLEGIALGVQNYQHSILVKLRISLQSNLNGAKANTIASAILNEDLIDKWNRAINRLLPQEMRIEYRAERHDLLLTIPLWKSLITSQQNWKWSGFYHHVLEPNARGMSPLGEARKLIPFVETMQEANVVSYFLIQLDGLFVKTYNNSYRALVSVPHTISNSLEHLSQSQGDAEKLDVIAKALRRLSRDLIEIGSVRKDEFDLHRALSELVLECQVLYPDISFELPQVSRNSTAIIFGSKDHIILALRDIVHNAVDAIRETKPEQQIVKITVLGGDDGFSISILNTGAANATFAEGSGTGERTVDRIVRQLHHGTVKHGPLSDTDPFHYSWNLFFPARVS